MCGIIGFAGKTEAVPILLDGLERLNTEDMIQQELRSYQRMGDYR